MVENQWVSLGVMKHPRIKWSYAQENDINWGISFFCSLRNQLSRLEPELKKLLDTSESQTQALRLPTEGEATRIIWELVG